MRADTVFRTMDRTQVAWRAEARELPRGTPWVSDEVIVANGTPEGTVTGARLHALDAEGRGLWESPVKTNMNAEPLGDGKGRVFAGNRDGLACVDAADGHLLWQTDSFEMMRCLPPGADPWEADGGVGRPALSPDGSTVYFGLLEGSVVACEADTGRKLWHAPLGHYMNHPAPVVRADGVLALTDDGGRMAILNPDGQVRREVELAPRTTNPVLDPEGRACVGTSDGRLLAVDLEDGRTVRTAEVPGREIRLEPVVDPAGRILVASGTPWSRDGGPREAALHCFEPSGEGYREVWSRDLPAPASSLAVDAEGVVAVACGERGVRFYDPEGKDHGLVTDHTVTSLTAGDGVFLAAGRKGLEGLKPRLSDLPTEEAPAAAAGEIGVADGWVTIGDIRLPISL